MVTKEHKSAVTASWVDRNRDRNNATRRHNLYSLKLRVIAIYGGSCSCCGYSVVDSLTVDHVHGGGTEEYRNGDRTSSRTLWNLAKESYGDGRFQILCMNCNHSKHVNSGICCHHGGKPKEAVHKSTKSGRKLRNELITGLGGKCSCCDESEFGFLTIDHVHNDGKQHRNEKGGRGGSLRDIRKNGLDTTKYQVLCFNCNLNKEVSGGVCLCKTGRVIEPPPTRKLTEVSLMSPEGETISIVNLYKFCVDNGLSVQNVRNVMKGRRKTVKGWKLPTESQHS